MIGKGRLLTYTGKLVDKKYFYQKEKKYIYHKISVFIGLYGIEGARGWEVLP